jgi:mannose-1-phosphate guanylyltransferase
MKTKTSQDRYVIIMAGGRGERFWPSAARRRPSNSSRCSAKRSFLQQAVERVRRSCRSKTF